MRLKKWIYLFWTSLVVGGVAAVIVGMLLRLFDQEVEFFGLSAFGINFLSMFVAGMMFSVVSQMGFFAYLTLNYIARGIFGSRTLWTYIQLFLFIVVIFELGYLPYLNFAEEGESIFGFFVLPVIVLVLSLIIAYRKSKLTNFSAFIPTLFFMGAGTVLEAIPVLQMDKLSSIVFMMIPLFLCNAWQILKLHELISKRPGEAIEATAVAGSATTSQKSKKRK